MKLQVGNMWDAFDEADLFLFTANSTLNGKGELVMGKGIAKQVKDRFPLIPAILGGVILEMVEGSNGEYNIAISPRGHKFGGIHKVGAFQVKHHWKLNADIDLIRSSVTVLRWWCADHQGDTVHMNYPGIGNGRLSIEQVEPIIATLPDNVTVWRLP